VNNELQRLENLLHEQSRSSSAQRLNSRSAYTLLLALFVVSRIVYYLLGVRFDARPILNFFQFIDPELLKHRLLESLYYLHVQPPGFNLYTGIVLKLFPDAYPAEDQIRLEALGDHQESKHSSLIHWRLHPSFQLRPNGECTSRPRRLTILVSACRIFLEVTGQLDSG